MVVAYTLYKPFLYSKLIKKGFNAKESLFNKRFLMLLTLLKIISFTQTGSEESKFLSR